MPDAAMEVTDAGCPEASPLPLAVPCLADSGPSIVPGQQEVVVTTTIGFQWMILATCGTPPYEWVFSGQLPQGVSADVWGGGSSYDSFVISGQPRESATCPYLFELEVRDSLGRTAAGTLSLQINP
jgi:hypothetical protein